MPELVAKQKRENNRLIARTITEHEDLAEQMPEFQMMPKRTNRIVTTLSSQTDMSDFFSGSFSDASRGQRRISPNPRQIPSF